jgi:phosphate transport system substrate-binding protein
VLKKAPFVFMLIFIGLILGGCVNNKGLTIKVYTRDTTSGTRDGFFSTIGFEEAVKDNAVLVKGYVEVAGNGEMINAIRNDENGIGYISLSSLPSSNLKGLTYAGVEPSENNVLNGTYKLIRNFNYITRKDYESEKVEQIVEAFIAYLKTKDAKATIRNKDGIIAMNDDDPYWSEMKDQYPVSKEDNSGITIRFGGSTSVEKIARQLSSEFSLKCGNFIAEHNHTGSGDAYKRTQGSEKDSSNKLDVAFASREFKVGGTEPAAVGTYGKICMDAIVAVVNKSNGLSDITADILKKLYNGSIATWERI